MSASIKAEFATLLHDFDELCAQARGSKSYSDGREADANLMLLLKNLNDRISKIEAHYETKKPGETK